MSAELGGAPQHFRYRFGAVEFDSARFELRVSGALVDVQNKPLRLLALLLEHAGEVLSRDTLYDAVWGDRVTVEHVLANAVSKLRSALGQAHGERIVTVPRQGYRLDGPVERWPLGEAAPVPLVLQIGQAVPGRASLVLQRRLGESLAHETWLAIDKASGQVSVFKFAAGAAHLDTLRRELTVHRLLHEALGARDSFTQVIEWNFATPPYWLESAYAGQNLLDWAGHGIGGALAQLTFSQRLQLFLQVADAVSAAHSLGVLHRDLKPANILIEQASNGWLLRLTDFGSARLLDPERLEALRITRLGMTLQGADGGSGGTPLYMAPELCNGAAPSVAADVYALGVLLFQLLVADLRLPLASGWEREIDDGLLREDIAGAVDGDPGRRFASVAELARRLQNLPGRRQAQQAAEAAEREATSALADLAQARARRPWALAAIVLALVAAVSGLGWGFAERADRLAQALPWQQATALNQFFGETLVNVARPGQRPFEDLELGDALEQAAGQIDERWANAPASVRASLHQAAQHALSQAARSSTALVQGQKALAVAGSPSKQDRGLRRQVRLMAAQDELELGRAGPASDWLRAEQTDAAGGPSPSPDERLELAFLLARTAAAPASVAAGLEQAWQSAQDPAITAGLRDRVALALAEQWRALDQAARSETLLRPHLALQRKRLGETHLQVAFTQVALGRAVLAQGRQPEAFGLLRDGYINAYALLGGRQVLWIRELMDELGQLQLQLGDPVRARRYWEELLEWQSEHEGAHSSFTLFSRAHIGLAQLRSGQAEQALPVLRQALADLAAVLAPQAAQSQYQRTLLAECLLALKRHAEAGALLADIQPQALESLRPGAGWPRRLQELRAAASQGRAPA